MSDVAAIANDLHADLPPALAVRLDDALGETKRSVDALAALVAQTEASLHADRPVICDVGGALERAVRLAAPAVDQRVKLVVERGAPMGIKNCGSMLECLLAILVVDLAQSQAPRQAMCVSLRAEAARGSLSIEIGVDGVAESETSATSGEPSWRLALAHELAGKLGARILPQLEAATYVVQFR